MIVQNYKHFKNVVLRVMDDIKFEHVEFLHGKLLHNVFEEICVFGSKNGFFLELEGADSPRKSV